MGDSGQFSRKIRFGPFEFDSVSEELRKHGTRIRLQQQPLRVLVALLTRTGQVVTRDDLRRMLWPDNTFVDFEHGVHAAVNRLRQALSDSADQPQYVETIQGIGYKWIGTIETADRDVATGVDVPASPIAEPRPAWPPPSRASVRAWMLPAATLIVGAVCGYFLRPMDAGRAPATRKVEFTVPAPEGFVFEPAITRQDFALSPDGARLAFIASNSSTSRLWLREFTSLENRLVAPDNNVRGVNWSPDSKSVFFDERSTIRRVSMENLTVETICELPLGPPWMGLLRTGADLILYTRAGTYKLPSPGGTPQKLDNAPYNWTQALPDGRRLEVEFNRAIHRYNVVVRNMDNSGNRKVLIEADSRAVYSPPMPGERFGNLLYVRAGDLMARAFDVNSLRLEGDPWVVAEQVFSFAPSAAAAFSLSENGLLAYRTAPPSMRLKWFDRNGRELADLGGPAPYLGLLRLSPDSKRLATPIYNIQHGFMDIWVQDLADSGSRRKLVNTPAARSSPVWSPTGDRVAFLRAEGGQPELYWSRLGSSAEEERLASGSPRFPTDWSHDGRLLAFQTGGGVGEPESDISVIDFSNDRRIVPLIHSSARELGAVFCPDDACLAFLSDETGRPELYLQDLKIGDEPQVIGDRRKISTDGALAVRWRSDGRELFYVNAENVIVAVPISRQHLAGPPRRLFRSVTPVWNLSVAGPDWGFDVSPDGERFLLVDGRGSPSSPLVIVENWRLTRR